MWTPYFAMRKQSNIMLQKQSNIMDDRLKHTVLPGEVKASFCCFCDIYFSFPPPGTLSAERTPTS